MEDREKKPKGTEDEEREKKPKATEDEEPDVEGHKKIKRDDSPTIERESLSLGERT
jgi:hypothetical protein